MKGSEIINLILNELGVKAPTFAKEIGLKYQRILDIQIGKTQKISSQVAEAIIEKYPQFNRNWLLTGEGEMILNGIHQNISGNGNTAVAGNGNTVQSSDMARALDEIAEQRRLAAKAVDEIAEQRKLAVKTQEQIDRLLSIIEKQHN